jgi:hypothetical protein
MLAAMLLGDCVPSRSGGYTCKKGRETLFHPSLYQNPSTPLRIFPQDSCFPKSLRLFPWITSRRVVKGTTLRYKLSKLVFGLCGRSKGSWSRVSETSGPASPGLVRSVIAAVRLHHCKGPQGIPVLIGASPFFLSVCRESLILLCLFFGGGKLAWLPREK